MVTKEQTVTLTIAVGKYSATYVLCETTAPPEYDGFGTFTYYEGPPRYILVREEHLNWQVGRNRSGLYSFRVCDETYLQGDIADFIWRRLTA